MGCSFHQSCLEPSGTRIERWKERRMDDRRSQGGKKMERKGGCGVGWGGGSGADRWGGGRKEGKRKMDRCGEMEGWC